MPDHIFKCICYCELYTHTKKKVENHYSTVLVQSVKGKIAKVCPKYTRISRKKEGMSK